ncbi:flavodoxin family protein [Nocardiopsis coralliicola]
MARLLIVHHTPSPAMQELFEAVRAGTATDGVEGVAVEVRAALNASPADVLAADAVILGTPANIGYMSGALKVFFDNVYYPCLNDTAGLPYTLYVHGNDDTAGASTAVARIAKGMSWTPIRPPVESVGPVTKDTRDACWELGAVAALAAAGEL